METKVEALQDNKVKVTVTVDAKEVDNRIKKAYKDFANKYNFPGFRKGKAPRPIIDNALGAEAVPASVTDDIVNGCYPLAIDSCNLYPVGEPEFGEPALVEGGKPYEFSFEVECKPTCELSDYEPVEVKLPAEGASEAEIDQQIEALRDYYHEFENANANTKVKADSYADLKIAATDENGEDVSTLSSESRMCLMGSGMFPAAFDEQVIGLKKGQTASFSVNVEDAKDATLMASLEGKTKTVNFEVEVLAVKKQVLPELTDEWVKDTLGFDDVADLRERVADSIKEQKEDVLPRMKENACLIELAKRLDVEVPAAVQEQTEAKLLQDFFSQLQNQGASFDMYLQQNGITADQFKADVKQQAADTAKQDMALDAWAAHFELKVTDEEVLEEFEKSGAKDPKALLKEWREGGRLYLVREALLRTHAVLDVMEKAKVTEYDPAEEAEEEKKAAKKSSKKAAKKEEEAADAEA